RSAEHEPGGCALISQRLRKAKKSLVFEQLQPPARRANPAIGVVRIQPRPRIVQHPPLEHKMLAHPIAPHPHHTAKQTYKKTNQSQAVEKPSPPIPLAPS